MAPEQHAQYLEYLERFSYFARPGQARLTAAQWTELANELAELSKVTESTVRGRRERLRAALLED